MKGYIGEFDVKIEETEFKDYTPKDWAMYFISRYGQIDGDHHKAWVLDQVARILNGTPVVVKEAHWVNEGNSHKEYRVWTAEEPSPEYKAWVTEMLGKYDAENDEYEYAYEEGIAP